MTAVLRVMGLAGERHFTNDHRAVHRGTWSARQASQILLGALILVLLVDGRFAAVSLALAWVKNHVVTVSSLRWDAALDQRPGPQPSGKRGANPLKGKLQRSLQGWAEHVDWYGGKWKRLWVFSRTALWYAPRLLPVEIRFVLVCDPEGKLRQEAFCKDLQATPAQILHWIIIRRWVEVTFEEPRAHLGLETNDSGLTTPWRAPSPSRWRWSREWPCCPSVEPGRSDPGAGDGIVSQSRADPRGLCGPGASASLACPV